MIHPNMFPKVIKMESNVINGDLLFILLPFANHQDASKTIVFPTFNVQPESFAGNRASDGYILSL